MIPKRPFAASSTAAVDVRAERRAAAPNTDAQLAASAQPKLRKKKLAKPYRYRPGNPSRRIARL